MECGATLVKYLIFIFNVVFFLSGILILTVGALVQANQQDYYNLVGTNVAAVAILLIVVGCFVTVIAFFGCCGAIRESKCMLYTFAGLLCVIFVMEFAGGIAAFVYRDDLKTGTEKQLNKTLEQYNYSNPQDPITKDWDDMQEELHCCGVTSYMSYAYLNVSGETVDLPDSCCKQPKPGCGKGQATNATAIWDTGCLDALVNEINKNAVLLGSIGISIAFIQILGIVFACCLAGNIQN